MRTFLILTTLLACALPAAAQPYGGDLIVAATDAPNGGNALLYRLAPGGRVTTILRDNLGLGSVSALAMDHANQNLFAVHDSGWIARVDATTGTVQTLWNGGPLTRPIDMCISPGGDIVALGFGPNANGAFEIATAGNSIRTLWTGLPVPAFIAPDLFSGDYVIGNSFPPTLYRVSRDGNVVTTIFNSPSLVLSDFVQDHLDGSWYANVNAGGVINITPGGKTTWIDRAQGGWAVAMDRAAGTGELVVAGTTIRRMTRSGTVVSTLPAPPAGWRVSRLIFDRERNITVERRGSPNLWRINLSIPGDATRRFSVIASLAGFTPGVPIGARTLPLVPDDLFRLTATASAHLLQGNHKTLDAQGEATITLDLRAFGSALSDAGVWLAVVTFDPSAPSGISTISKPTLIVLD